MNKMTSTGGWVVSIAVITFTVLTAAEFNSGSWERAILWLLLATVAVLAGKRGHQKPHG